MIRKIEELSINAFPTQETMYYDGWILRISEGKSKRLNSVYSLYPSTIDIEEKIKTCEDIYSNKNLRRVFKLTNQSTPENLDSLLRNRGYQEAGRTSIQTLDLSTFKHRKMIDIEVLSGFSEEWFKDYCVSGNKSNADAIAFRNAWTNLIPKHCFISYKLNGERIAFAMGVMQDNYIGVFGVLVKDHHRRKGYGELITRELLNYGKSMGNDKSYLQVEVVNTNANSLYRKLGFEEEYQYWYLLKDIGQL